MPDYLPYLPLDPDLFVYAGLALVFIWIILLHLRFHKRRQIRRRKEEMVLFLENFKTVIDTLETIGEQKSLSHERLRACEDACGKLALIGDESLADLCGKTLAVVKTYAIARATPQAGDSPQDHDQRQALAEAASKNALNLARLVVAAATERLKGM